MVSRGILHRQVLPVERVRNGLVEIAVFHDDLIGPQVGRQFVDIAGIGGIIGIIAFGGIYNRCIHILMANDEPLPESPDGRIFMVNQLVHHHFIFLAKESIAL